MMYRQKETWPWLMGTALNQKCTIATGINFLAIFFGSLYDS